MCENMYEARSSLSSRRIELEKREDQEVSDFSMALEAARELQVDWLKYGLEAVYLPVEDVEGN